MKLRRLCLILTVFAVLTARAQTFSNLNFENATVVPTVPMFGWLDWNLAAPGWNHSSGNDTSSIYYGQEHLGLSQYYMLYDSQSPVYAPGTQLAGNYSLGFASGYADGNSPATWTQAYLSQTGPIALGIQSIRFLARGAPFALFVGGVQLPVVSLGGNAYGGDVSAFAGTTAEFRIVNLTTTLHTPVVLDNVSFSTVPVPEPASLILAAAGLLVLLCARRATA